MEILLNSSPSQSYKRKEPFLFSFLNLAHQILTSLSLGPDEPQPWRRATSPSPLWRSTPLQRPRIPLPLHHLLPFASSIVYVVTVLCSPPHRAELKPYNTSSPTCTQHEPLPHHLLVNNC